MKILSHYPLVLPSKFRILELFAKPFHTERKLSKCPTKEKTGERKAKEAGRRESKILLSAHARTSKDQGRKLV